MRISSTSSPALHLCSAFIVPGIGLTWPPRRFRGVHALRFASIKKPSGSRAARSRCDVPQYRFGSSISRRSREQERGACIMLLQDESRERRSKAAGPPLLLAIDASCAPRPISPLARARGPCVRSGPPIYIDELSAQLFE